jgi:DNA-binding LacI/PurR family transcriptional regulator
MAGYSVSTVSKALNNKKDINSETKNKIRNIALKYNFTPNTMAVSLRKRKSNTIALIIPQINTPTYGFFISNFQHLAFEHGYKTLLYQTFEDSNKYKSCLNKLNDGSVDGVMVLSAKEMKEHFGKDMVLPFEYKDIVNGHSQEHLEEESTVCFRSLLSKMKS